MRAYADRIFGAPGSAKAKLVNQAVVAFCAGVGISMAIIMSFVLLALALDYERALIGPILTYAPLGLVGWSAALTGILYVRKRRRLIAGGAAW